ncbi:MAG: cytochrome c [bacterium]
MRKFLVVIGSLAVLGLVAVAAIIWVPAGRTPAQPEPAIKMAEATPEYAARLGDCAGCHTAPGGKPFAGGLAVASPLGTIWSSNITPDPDHGIGKWTLADFRGALYDGISRDGHRLYPAMPSSNYRTFSEQDVKALYAYFTKDVAPVAISPPETKLSFPFNQRWGLRVWEWIAYPKAGFVPSFDDPVLNRGAYLVEGPGHCGACHTPRTATLAQAAYTATDAAFLSGGSLGAWTVPSLRGPNSAPTRWTVAEMTTWLTTGRNAHAGVAGEMVSVIQHSTQYLTDDDASAVATYLRHVAWNGDPPKDVTSALPPSRSATETLLRAAAPDMALGPRLYLDNCNACHFVNGMGAGGVFPKLVGNSTVLAKAPGGLLDVVLNGASMPSTAARPSGLRMPGFGHRLSDAEAAALLTFVRSAWGNSAGVVSADDVRKARGAAQ